MYVVELKPKAQRFIETQTKKVQRQLIKRIEVLAANPHPPNSKLLHGRKNLYSYRSGNYRIIYQVRDKEGLVIIAKVGQRGDIYKVLGN